MDGVWKGRRLEGFDDVSIVPIDVVVVVVIQSIKNNKNGVSILIEFPW